MRQTLLFLVTCLWGLVPTTPALAGGPTSTVSPLGLTTLEAKADSKSLEESVVSGDGLEKLVSEKEIEAKRARLKEGFWTILGSMWLFGVFAWFYYRKVRWSGLSEAFEEEYGIWRERITNARINYVDFNFTSLTALSKATGKTKEQYDKTTEMVNRIYLNIDKLERHILYCKNEADKAGFFRLKPLEDALYRMRWELELDSEETSQKGLFGASAKIKVKPESYARVQAEQFEKAKESWDQLVKAAQLRLKDPREVFSRKGLDSLLALCKENQIPSAWVGDHPLYEDSIPTYDLYEGKVSIYETLNEIRWQDPLAYATRLERMRETESVIKARLQIIIILKNQVEDAALEMPSDLVYEGCPSTDPRIALNEAKARFERSLEDSAESKNTAALQGYAQQVSYLHNMSKEDTSDTQRSKLRRSGRDDDSEDSFVEW